MTIQVRGERPAQKKVDPLILDFDLDGDGVEISSLVSEILFDIEARGNVDCRHFSV